MEASDILRIICGGLLFWIGTFFVTKNIRSKLAWIIFLFLISLSWYIVFVDAITPLFVSDVSATVFYYRFTNWTYILPIPLILHFSLLTTGRSRISVNRHSLLALYSITFVLILASIFTELVVDTRVILNTTPEFGIFFARGPLFPLIGVISAWSSLQASWNFLSKYREAVGRDRKKFALCIVGASLYAVVGPFLVFIYYSTSLYDLAVNITSPLLILPVVFWLIAILFFKLISDVDSIFNLKEFIYTTVAITIITFASASVVTMTAEGTEGTKLMLLTSLTYLLILTHAFYDWLTTFIRDLLYNPGRGFSIITDKDATDLVKDFHNPTMLEMNPFLRFKAVRDRAKEDKLIDSAQQIVCDAIDYFKQSDFPRRTKMNMKYQILKMLTCDDSEEGQILWELGFEGYPVKIMHGENSTRKPLFKVESMSDYTAVSRNAFIALKKEAIHDLGWRLSYLEKTHSKNT